MFGLSARLPVSEEERQWVNQGFERREKMLGRGRMLEANVMLPTAQDFPDPYDTTPPRLKNSANACAPVTNRSSNRPKCNQFGILPCTR